MNALISLIVYSQRLRRRERRVPKALKVKKELKRRRSLITDLPLLELENRPKTHLVSATSWLHSTTPSSTLLTSQAVRPTPESLEA